MLAFSGTLCHCGAMETEIEGALLTAPQVATVLGKSSETVLRMARLGRIPVAVKLTGRNGMVLFSRDAIREMAEAEVDRIHEALRSLELL